MSTKRLMLFILLTLLVLLIAACSATNTSTASPTATGDIFNLPKNAKGYTDISIDQLKPALDNKNFTLVNVHIPYEGELPQTDTFIPYNEIEANLNQLPADKNAKIVLYCRSGRMSDEAAQTLAGLGYTHIVEVDGGMQAWQSAGNELINK